MAISTAISTALKTRAVGYQLLDRVFNPQSRSLPQKIAVLGEPNTADEATLITTPWTVTSLKDVGDRYGYGSNLYGTVRILLPVNGGGVGSIPVTIYPQEYSLSAVPTATTREWTAVVATTVTKTTTHYLKVNGRDNIDGKSYGYTVTLGDDAEAVMDALNTALANVLAAPITGANTLGVATFTSKWKGLTSAGLTIEIDTDGEAAGVVYSETATTDGTGTPDITAALAAFGEEWNTLVVNPYNVTAILAQLEVANGTPAGKDGRYTTTTFKPFQALFGSIEDDKDALVAITNATSRKTEVTNVLCPAPNSAGWDFEAAANGAVLQAVTANDTPHLGIGGQSYPDMPIPTDGIIGDMSDIDNRNFCMIRGCSTVLLENGSYTVQDFVNTYAPDGDANPKFSYVRDLNADWVVGYNWKIIMLRDIQDKAIVEDDAPVNVGNTISPKQVKALGIGLVNDMRDIAIIVDPAFSIAAMQAGINATVAGRIDFSFPYKRSSTANQVSTDASVDFNYPV